MSDYDIFAFAERIHVRFGSAATIVAVSTGIGLAIEWLLRRAVLWRSDADSKRVRTALALSLRGLPTYLGVLIGIRTSLVMLDLEPRVTEGLARLVLALSIAGITFSGARAAGAIVRLWMTRDETGLPSSTLIVILVRGAVVTVGAVTIMSVVGIPVSPLITALGVGGIGLSLALQDPLSNMFSGIQVLLSGEVRPGDFLKLESGEEGWVRDVTWRNMTLRQPSNDLIIVPNAIFAKSVVTNYTTVDSEHVVWVDVGVSYDSDLNHVEDVTREVAAAVSREMDGAVTHYEPLSRFCEFGDSAIELRVSLRVRSYDERWLVRSEFIKRLHARYAQEGIEIPFPQRDVHVTGDLVAPPLDENDELPRPTGPAEDDATSA